MKRTAALAVLVILACLAARAARRPRVPDGECAVSECGADGAPLSAYAG